MSCTIHNPAFVTDGYGTSLDKLDMTELIAHEVATHNQEAFNWHPREDKPGYLTRRTIHSRITLADVLHTIMKKGLKFSFNHNFLLIVRYKDGKDIGSVEWDCSADDLDKQDEETVRVLYNILYSYEVIRENIERMTALSDAYRDPYSHSEA